MSNPAAYLLDTHALIWLLTDDAKLSPRAKTVFLDVDNELQVSTATLWDMAIKVRLGKLRLGATAGPLADWLPVQLRDNQILTLPVRAEHALAVQTLPHVHRDPFDRLLVAQCLHEGLTLLSCDTALDGYEGLRRVW